MLAIIHYHQDPSLGTLYVESLGAEETRSALEHNENMFSTRHKPNSWICRLLFRLCLRRRRMFALLVYA